MKEICTVFLCNKAFLPKFKETCTQLLTNGKYKDDICLIIGDDLKDEIYNEEFIIENNIIVKYFPYKEFTDDFKELQTQLIRQYHHVKQQYICIHKINVFDMFFKQWKYIYYLDCGATIFSDIYQILNLRKEDTLLAHSDAYPSYTWRLHDQFDKTKTKYFDKLQHNFNLNIDYFQATTLLFDTSIIDKNTVDDLYKLMIEYPICITNEQGIMALYFTNIKPRWQQIPIKNDNTYLYDFMIRNKEHKYVVLKRNY
jgi:hypothetical protein